MRILLEKAGTNPDQAHHAFLEGVEDCDLKVGEVLHIAGQPDDVKWRVAARK